MDEGMEEEDERLGEAGERMEEGDEGLEEGGEAPASPGPCLRAAKWWSSFLHCPQVSLLDPKGRPSARGTRLLASYRDLGGGGGWKKSLPPHAGAPATA